MTPEEQEKVSAELRFMLGTPGWRYLKQHIDLEILEGWEKFISLPVERKTSKQAYNQQSRYDVLKKLLEWIRGETDLA